MMKNRPNPLDDHAKVVALRNQFRSEKDFKRHLKKCGWNNEEIAAMWGFAERYGIATKDGILPQEGQ